MGSQPSHLPPQPNSPSPQPNIPSPQPNTPSPQPPTAQASDAHAATGSRSGLCIDCSNLDLQEILKTPAEFWERADSWQEVCDLDWIRSTQGCPLCDIFNQAIINYSGPLSDHHTPKLVWQIGSKFFWLNSAGMDSFKVLGVMFSGVMFSGVPRALLLPTDARRLLAPQMPKGRRISNPINWGILKQWLSDCDEGHSTDCMPERKLEVAGMRFIDCESLEIVPSPKPPPPYITLSYLWGRAGDHTEGPLSSGMPLVVEDAIQVVKELGFRYLWVDRYCITQDDGPEMHILIPNMDQIYSCAAFTVIANGETNTCYGLPGVNSISRAPQPTFQIGSEEYTFCWLNTREMIEHSEWNTRGWTFQEALLSTRKLVFTENQVYFQCQRTVYLESLEWPPTYACEKWKTFPDRDVYHWDHMGELATRIAEYWPRKLAFKSDRYNAFQGVLKSFSQKRTPVDNIYGIPIFGMFSAYNMAKPVAIWFVLAKLKQHFTQLHLPKLDLGRVGGNYRNDNDRSLWPFIPHNDDPWPTFLCKSVSVVFDATTSLDLDEQFGDILERSLLKGPPPCLTLSCILFDVKLSTCGTTGSVMVDPLHYKWEDSLTKIDHPEAGRPEGFKPGALVCWS